MSRLFYYFLSDVDFVVEEEDKLLCLEYKNANIKNADAPEVFRQKIIGKDFWVKIAKKFYGSMFLIWACNKNESDKPVEYIFLMECNPKMDAALKKRFMMKMMRQLPFKYNDKNEIKRAVIDDFRLLDLKEWEEKYPQYPIYAAENIEENNHGGA